MNVVELDGSVYEQTFYHLEGMFFNYLITCDRNPFVAPFSKVLEAIGRAKRNTPYGEMLFVQVLHPGDFLDAWAEASYRYGNAYVHEWSLLSNKQKERIRERAN